ARTRSRRLAAGPAGALAPPPRGACPGRGPVGSSVGRAPRRHAHARAARAVADPRDRGLADLPRDVRALPVHRPRRGRGLVGQRALRPDLDARPRLPAARWRRGVLRLGRARHGPRRVRQLGRGDREGQRARDRGTRQRGRPRRSAASAGPVGRGRPVRARDRRGAAPPRGAPGRGERYAL
ncbi:MAG: hypothetical protein AVDCRST_MAG85-676, partial [uncultured Solirubrobacteraceae bacterium]